MFGYVRPLENALTEEDSRRYQAAYCGLCRTIGARYGRFARMFLNYDFIFLSMLLSERPEKLRFCSRPCPTCPIHARTAWEADEGIELAAGESVILAWWKLQDQIRDGGLRSRFTARGICLLLRRGYHKAAQRYPAFDRSVRENLDSLHGLETESCASMDRAADPFARMLQAAAPDSRGREVQTLLYHLGRWIYLLDAWDDLEEDRKNGNYNPVTARFGALSELERSYLRSTMHVSLGLALDASERAELGQWRGIVENVIQQGLPIVEEAVFAGQWKQRKGLRRFRHERSLSGLGHSPIGQ